MTKITLVLTITLISFSSCIYGQNGPQLTRIEGQGNDGIVLDFFEGMHDSILNSSTNIYKYPVYKNNQGPVNVDIYNPSLTPSGDFALIFNDTTIDFVGNDILANSSKWRLIHIPTNVTVYGDSIIGLNYTQDIAQWGIKIKTNPTDDPGTSNYTNNGFLEATMTFANPSLNWLTGLSDTDINGNQNWIRSGTQTFSAPYNVFNDIAGIDDAAYYENIIGGTWAPYRLCASTPVPTPNPLYCSGGPAWGKMQTLTQLSNLASIDLVITNDQSKWTRCPVLELQEETALAIGGAKKMNLRASNSVDKNGDGIAGPDNNDFPTGMGWFPGYAINIETGERLNMAFGEDSWLPSENGADMKWNPTSHIFSIPSGDVLFGGKHYIYVFGHNGDKAYAADPLMGNGLKDVPVYDKGEAIHNLLSASLNATSTSSSDAYKREVYADAMWVNVPLLNQGFNLFDTDVKIHLRVSKKYKQQSIDGTNNTNNKYIFNKNTLVGINENNSAPIFKIYPNPANTQITIDYTMQTKNAVIEIYNTSGQKIESFIYFNSQQTIDIRNLSDGLYLIKITDGNNSYVKRFVKQ